MSNLNQLMDRSFGVLMKMDDAVTTWTETGDESVLDAMFAKAAQLIVVDGEPREGEVVLKDGEYLCTVYGMVIPFNPVAETEHSQILAGKLGVEFAMVDDTEGQKNVLAAISTDGTLDTFTYAAASPVDADDETDVQLTMILGTLAIALQIAEDRGI